MRKRKRIIRDYHLTSLNVNDKLYAKDSFVLAKQAQHVFYLDDPNLGSRWKVIQKIDTDIYGMCLRMNNLMMQKQIMLMGYTKEVRLAILCPPLKMIMWI